MYRLSVIHYLSFTKGARRRRQYTGSSGGAGDGGKETTAVQCVFIGDLDSLPVIISDRQVLAPILTLVGLILVNEVVALHDRLNWYRPGEEISSDYRDPLSQIGYWLIFPGFAR